MATENYSEKSEDAPVLYPNEASLLPDDGQSIRLVVIRPSHDASSQIQCTTQVARLEDQPEFEALSYRWSSDGHENISLDGSDTPVTRNLASALRALRLAGSDRVIWIDALCINQKSNHEKSYQVPLMRKIYGNSKRVVVWLGPTDRQSTAAFRAIRKKQKSYPRSLTSVLRRTWFGRVWMIQEVAVASQAVVQCGDDAVGWDDLISMVEKIPQLGSTINPRVTQEKKHLHPSFYPRVLDAARKRFREGKLFEIGEALRWFHPFDATDARDKIYGIRGLLDDPSLVKVDYESSTGSVFSAATLGIIKRSRKLGIFLDCLQSNQNFMSPAMPTWVPDWSDVDRPLDHPMSTITAKETFHASQDTEIGDIRVQNEGCLTIQGHIIGHVAELGPLVPTMEQIRANYWPRRLPNKRGFNIIKDVAEIFSAWKEVCLRTVPDSKTLADPYPTGETLFEAFYNLINLNEPLEADYNVNRQYDKWAASIEYTQRYFSWWTRNIGNRLHWLLVWIIIGPSMTVFSMILVYKLITGEVALDAPRSGEDPSRLSLGIGRTDTGLIGVFPGPSVTSPNVVETQPGDAIVLFRGAARPYVLRRAGEHAFRLIGDAYVHGIMHGGAFQEDACIDIQLI